MPRVRMQYARFSRVDLLSVQRKLAENHEARSEEVLTWNHLMRDERTFPSARRAEQRGRRKCRKRRTAFFCFTLGCFKIHVRYARNKMEEQERGADRASKNREKKCKCRFGCHNVHAQMLHRFSAGTAGNEHFYFNDSRLAQLHLSNGTLFSPKLPYSPRSAQIIMEIYPTPPVQAREQTNNSSISLRFLPLLLILYSGKFTLNNL